MTRSLGAAVLGCVLVLTLAGCGGDTGAVVTWETVDGSRFYTEISDPDSLAQIRAALESDGRAGIPNGRLVRGNGGVNQGHQWHMVDVELVEMAIELCDGTATMVDDDLDYWIDTVGQYCPWDARVVAIEG